jgi:hypothetical protein
VRFTQERYDRLRQMANERGRSVSEQVEAMIEELIIIQETLAASRTDDRQLRDGVFRREHRPITTPYGTAWWPKADPKGPPAEGSVTMGDKP